MSYKTKSGKVALVLRTNDGDIIKTTISGEDLFGLFFEKRFLDKDDAYIKERVELLAAATKESPPSMKYEGSAIVQESIALSVGSESYFAPANNGLVVIDCEGGLILSAHNLEDLRVIDFGSFIPGSEYPEFDDWFCKEVLLFEPIYGMDDVKRFYDYGRITRYCFMGEVNPFRREIPKVENFEDLIEFSKTVDEFEDPAFLIDVEPWQYRCFGNDAVGFAITLAVVNEMFPGIEFSKLEEDLWNAHLRGFPMIMCSSLEQIVGDYARVQPAGDNQGHTFCMRYEYALEMAKYMAESKQDFEFKVNTEDQTAFITGRNLQSMLILAASGRLRHFE